MKFIKYIFAIPLLAVLAHADICTYIASEIAALPVKGGTINIPAGQYDPCPKTLVISKNSVTINGAGWLNQLNGNGATTLKFAAGVTGIDITGASVTISNLNLWSASTHAGTDNGIQVRANNVTLDRIGVGHFGGAGILTLGNSPTNADSWHYTQIQSYLNFGDGYQWGTPCTDNHQGVGTLLTASVNGGWGFNILCGLHNKFISPLVQVNTLGGYHIGPGGSYNTFDNAYAETGTGSSFIIDNGALGTVAWFSAFGQPSTIQSNFFNEVHFWSDASTMAQNNLTLSPPPGTPGGTVYGLNSGGYSASGLGIWDYTNGGWIVTYAPDAGWSFNAPADFTALVLTPVAVSGLPACSQNEGSTRAVTDALTNSWGDVVNGGGTNHVLAYCDGTNWTVQAK